MSSMFQFLIGSLEALNTVCSMALVFEFQFLIGSLEAFMEKTDPTDRASFNSS